MEELFEGIAYGGADHFVKQGFEKKKEGEEQNQGGYPHGYVSAPGYAPVPGAPPYIPGSAPVAPVSHSEKAKNFAIEEVQKKKSGSQRLTNTMLSWMTKIKNYF